MASVSDNISKRISVRSYDERKIPDSVLAELASFMAKIKTGPFGTAVRFQFLDESGSDRDALRKLGTYGMIAGDRFYIAGAAVKGDYADVDYGYCLESIILKATELGLGTCWLGGTLNRGTFAEKIGLAENEILPALTPIGYPAERERKRTIIITTLMGARKRKDFASLFFEGQAGVPLSPDSLGAWVAAFEAVRAGPSASNKQPWRIVRDGEWFDFRLDYDSSYNSSFTDFSIQKVDMGIALCHFELTARELGLSGSWQMRDPAPSAGNLVYITSWKRS